jgi:hypothetical protein
MTDFLQYFETEKQYNDHQENNLNYFNTISYIEETDTVKYNDTPFPFYFESGKPQLIEYNPDGGLGGASHNYVAKYHVTPHVNLYNRLVNLCEIARTSNYTILPEEFLNLCPFYVNENKIIAIEMSHFFVKGEIPSIYVEFEDTNWESIDGWEFGGNGEYDKTPSGALYPDGTMDLYIGLVKS